MDEKKQLTKIDNNTSSENIFDSLTTVMTTARSTMTAMDWYTLMIMSLYSAVSLIAYPWIPGATTIIISDILFATAIIGISYAFGVTGNKALGLIKRFYVIPMVYPMYNHTQLIVPVLHPIDYDWLFISWDTFLFRGKLTTFMDGLAHPVLTEYLQICYVLFYILPLYHAIDLYRQGRTRELIEFGRIMVFAFYISYIAYFALPAIGPRFTLYNFSSLHTSLPALYFGDMLRDFVNTGGGIEPGALDAARTVNRDCMPSGHTMMTLINIILGWRYRSRPRWIFTIFGTSLIFSTMYLRYHYGVDVIAGVLLAFATFPLERRCMQWLRNQFGAIDDIPIV